MQVVVKIYLTMLSLAFTLYLCYQILRLIQQHDLYRSHIGSDHTVTTVLLFSYSINSYQEKREALGASSEAVYLKLFKDSKNALITLHKTSNF